MASTSLIERRNRFKVAENAVNTQIRNSRKSPGALNQQKRLLYRDLMRFFSVSANLQPFLKLNEAKVSLRILDCFVTNYARDFNVCYKIQRLGRVKIFNVYESYKAELKEYHKRLFDPFSRGERIEFEYYDGCSVKTTVGQLNFFRWAIQNKVIEYVQANLDKIGTYMKTMVDDAELGDSAEDKMKIDAEVVRMNNQVVAKIGFR